MALRLSTSVIPRIKLSKKKMKRGGGYFLSLGSMTLKDGTDRLSDMSLIDHKTTQPNIPEERRP
jgi:hypothetical protein